MCSILFIRRYISKDVLITELTGGCIQSRRGICRLKNRMVLYYQAPASKWEETLPIGNASLGAMIYGNVSDELLGLNEESLWSGYYHDKNNKDASLHLEQVRKYVFEKRYQEAEELIRHTMLGEYNESYLPLGKLHIKFHHQEEVKDYKRELDIEESIAKITYNIEDVEFTREYFASYPHKAIFIKLNASKACLNLSLSLQTELMHEFDYHTTGIIMRGQCPEHVDPSYIGRDEPSVIWGERGIRFQSEITVLSCDGTVSIHQDKDTLEQALTINDASEVVLMVQAVKRAIGYENRTYEEIKSEHIKDYKSIYDKVDLYLGDQCDLPTNERLRLLKEGKSDPSFYALYFQYGRYLLISCSREGSLPANLQGIWSWEFRAPWSSNWTTNINMEMNYWPAQSCNLNECLPPYFELLKRLCEEGKKTAKIHYNCRGFVHHHNADVWCNTNPVGLATGERVGYEGSVTWSFWPMGGAWMVSELYKNYEYYEDKSFLRETAYPILKEAALFFIDWLVEYQGEYVTCPSTSPENRFITPDGETSCVAMASTMDLTLVREVFDHFQKTCEELEIEDEILPEIKERLEKLAPFKVGSHGQLLEWNEEFEEQELGHRHISHLYGLFPSELFEMDDTLKNACRVSLERRLEHGGGHTGWSCAWILNMFAIFGDKENAYKYLKTLITKSTYDNLWDAHPPFQIDGNFGGIAGIANMLVQDRNGVLKILPALPDEFKSGYVKGLRIKYNKTIDIHWNNGKVTKQMIYHHAVDRFDWTALGLKGKLCTKIF